VQVPVKNNASHVKSLAEEAAELRDLAKAGPGSEIAQAQIKEEEITKASLKLVPDKQGELERKQFESVVAGRVKADHDDAHAKEEMTKASEVLKKASDEDEDSDEVDADAANLQHNMVHALKSKTDERYMKYQDSKAPTIPYVHPKPNPNPRPEP